MDDCAPVAIPIGVGKRVSPLWCIKCVRAAVGGDDVEKNSAVLGHWKITFKFLTPSVRGTMHSPTRLYRELREK